MDTVDVFSAIFHTQRVPSGGRTPGGTLTTLTYGQVNTAGNTLNDSYLSLNFPV